MIIRKGKNADQTYIEVRPNRSMNWRQLKVFCLLIGFVCFTIASYFAYLGLWLVLPFAGLEVALLTYCVYLNALEGQKRERLLIGKNEIRVVKSLRSHSTEWKFHRAFVRLQLKPSVFRGYPSKLLIGCHGKLVSLGSFLVEAERLELAKQLRKVILKPVWQANV